MISDTATIIAYLGAIVGLVGGGVALFNARKAVLWKRAELASNYLRELRSDEELVFACRALDWNGGRLVVPENLRPLIGDTAISHDPEVMRHAMRSDLTIFEMEEDPRIQLYRTSLDSLLSWLSLLATALNRKLFTVEDVKDVYYWIRHIERADFLNDFIETFGYGDSFRNLRDRFSAEFASPAGQPPAIAREGFGSSAKGRGASG
jgi:hypothetical protein